MTIAVEPSTGIKGQAEKRDDETLLLLALLSLADIEDAAIYWRRLADERYKGLINARIPIAGLPPTSVATSSIPAYDAGSLSYVRSDGTVITQDQVKSAVLGVLAASTAESVRDTESMLAGALELSEWQANALQRIKRLHVATAAVGAGGIKQLTADKLARSTEDIPADLGDVQTLGGLILFQFSRLDNFAQQIEAGEAGSPHAIVSRIGLYGASAYPTWAMGRSFAALIAGMTQERNVLSDAEHCRAEPGDDVEDCPTQTEKGWVQIGDLVPVGRRLCAMNCLCELKYRRSDAA